MTALTNMELFAIEQALQLHILRLEKDISGFSAVAWVSCDSLKESLADTQSALGKIRLLGPK